jgi:subtilase family serine protease
MKKLLAALAALLMSTAWMTPAHADSAQVLAIIDTALDSTKFPNVVYEACIVTDKSCNGASFQEGPGSANIPADAWKINGFRHGTQMVATALDANPNQKILFIRVSELHVYPTFSSQVTLTDAVTKALVWLGNNAAKYNVGAVSISQARTNFTACPNDAVMQAAVAKLKAAGVATFAASGDSGETNKIAFPACVPGIYSVGGVAVGLTKMAPITTYSPALSLVARTTITTWTYDGTALYQAQTTGTSISTPTAAAKLLASKSTKSWDELISGLPTVIGFKYVG